jgi:hypothetical protein
LRDQIAAWFDQGVSGVVIHTALKREHGYTGSYSAVRRMLGTLKRETPPDATVRLVFAPGEAAQVDFGAGPMLADAAGVVRRTWAFVMTLCFSRHERIRTQQPKDKNKRYALHAPEVECIGKGKARKPYEFSVKASIAVTHKRGLMVGTRTFPGNPYDGHVLNQQLEQTGRLLAGTGKVPKQVVVDLGYRGVEIIHRGKYKSLTKQQRCWLKRRQGVEPAIGHGEGAGSAEVSARKGLEPAGKDLRR